MGDQKPEQPAESTTKKLPYEPPSVTFVPLKPEELMVAMMCGKSPGNCMPANS